MRDHTIQTAAARYPEVRYSRYQSSSDGRSRKKQKDSYDQRWENAPVNEEPEDSDDWGDDSPIDDGWDGRDSRGDSSRDDAGWSEQPARQQYAHSQETSGGAGKNRRKKHGHPVLMGIFIILLILILAAGTVGLITVRSIINKAPDISGIMLAPKETATYIYDQDGHRTRKLTLPESNRDLVPLSSIPLSLQKAVIAIEDSRFYQHGGIDLKGIARAIVKGLANGGHFTEGASTITQQLLKNSVFTGWVNETSEEKIERKIQEQYLAIQLEKVMTKDEILEDYLNLINLGAGCYGVEAAAWRYFGKDVSQLTLSEATVIAGISQNPTAYNPITHPENNAKRRKQVLDAMLKQGYVSQAQYNEALADDVYSRIQNNSDADPAASSVYSYYEDALIDQVLTDLQEVKGMTRSAAYKALYSGGLRIYSAQDADIQKILDEEFADPSNFPAETKWGIDFALSVKNSEGEVKNYGNSDLRAWVRSSRDPSFDLMYGDRASAEQDASDFADQILSGGATEIARRVTINPEPQASCVIIDQKTGWVKAIEGGRGGKEASLTLNRASSTLRQPGSTFKIITTYAPALNTAKKTLATTYDNTPFAYEDGTPVSNWDIGSYTGPTTIRDAIVKSINVVAVRCITEITPRLGFEYAQKFGISSLVELQNSGGTVLSDVVQPLALGGITNGVSNLELTGAYAAIANNGGYIKPRFYSQVFDSYGNVLLDNSHPASAEVVTPQTSYLLTSAMRGVITDPQGTAYGKIDLGYMPVAGKSGTTSDYRDIWFVGYTPYYTCGVWGGNDNNAVLPSDDIGHSYSKVLWNSIMNRIHENLQITAFPTPSGIVTMEICADSHEAASPTCPNHYTEYFASGTEPHYYCSIHSNGMPLPSSAAATGNAAGGSGQSSSSQTNGDGSIVISGVGDGTQAGSTAGNAGNSGADASGQGSGDSPIVIYNSDSYGYSDNDAVGNNSASHQNQQSQQGQQAPADGSQNQQIYIPPATSDGNTSSQSAQPSQDNAGNSGSDDGGTITIYNSDQTILDLDNQIDAAG